VNATLVVRHKVADYTAWRQVYDELEPVRLQYGCTAKRVLRLPENHNDLLITHDFPSAEQAGEFAQSAELKEGMQRAGVDGQPQIEIFDVA
jgi:hypothetical protein